MGEYRVEVQMFVMATSPEEAVSEVQRLLTPSGVPIELLDGCVYPCDMYGRRV